MVGEAQKKKHKGESTHSYLPPDTPSQKVNGSGDIKVKTVYHVGGHTEQEKFQIKKKSQGE